MELTDEQKQTIEQMLTSTDGGIVALGLQYLDLQESWNNIFIYFMEELAQLTKSPIHLSANGVYYESESLFESALSKLRTHTTPTCNAIEAGINARILRDFFIGYLEQHQNRYKCNIFTPQDEDDSEDWINTFTLKNDE